MNEQAKKLLDQCAGTEMLRQELIRKFTAQNEHTFYLLVEKLNADNWRLHGMTFNPATAKWVSERTIEMCVAKKLDRTFAVLTVKVDRNDSATLLFCNDFFLY